MKLSVAQTVVDENISNDCKKKLGKLAKYMIRLMRKDSEYIETRDAVVMALKILTRAKEHSDNVKTTVAGHQRLNDLFDQIFEPEDPVEDLK